jgi:hypothetical protein
VDPDLINVLFSPRNGGGPQKLPRTFGGEASNCGSEHGWYYDDPASPGSVRLCPRTCSDARGADVELQFGCETVIAPPR